MADRPILFSAPMVRALLAGRKSQTRRAIKGVPSRDHYGRDIRCPYGALGDRLWVREGFSGPHSLRNVRPGLWDVVAVPPPMIWYWADGEPTNGDWTKPKPAIHMPRWASRITLEVTEVRVERLQDLTYEDVKAEGWPGPVEWISDDPAVHRDAARDWYSDLWDDLHGPRAWASNPWVWAVSFQRVEA